MIDAAVNGNVSNSSLWFTGAVRLVGKQRRSGKRCPGRITGRCATCSDYRSIGQDGIDGKYHDRGAQPDGQKYHAACPSKLQNDDIDQQGYLPLPSRYFAMASAPSPPGDTPARALRACVRHLWPNQHHLARPTAIEETIRLRRLIERESMGDQILERHTALDHEIRHLGQAAEAERPRAIDG
jgi:hypothetical protein